MNVRVTPPPSVLWLPSFRCDLRCRYCWNHGAFHVGAAEELPRIMNNLCADSVSTLTIAGGEPGLVPGLFEKLADLRDNISTLRVFTNGCNHSTLERLRLLSPEEIVVSMDSIVPQVNDRGREAGAKTMRGIGFLTKHCSGSRITLSICLTAATYRTLDWTLSWAKEIGVTSVQVTIVQRAPGVDNAEFRIGRDWQDLKRVLDGSIEILRGFHLRGSSTSADFLDLVSRVLVHGERPRGHCGATRCLVTIDPEGRIRYCPHRPEVLGDLRVETLRASMARWRDSLGLEEVRACQTVDCLHMFKEFS